MADPLECVICGTHITYPQRAPRLDALIVPKMTIRERLTLILEKEEDGIQDQSNQERICEICLSLLRRVDKSGCVLAKAKEQIIFRWRNKRLLKQFDPLSVLEEIEVHEEVVESNETGSKRKRKDSNASVSSNDGTSGKVKRGRPKKSMSTKYIEYNSTHLCSHCGVKLIEFQNHFCIYSPTCFICGAACGATRITSHILTLHPEVEQQKCSRCKSWFWTIEDLKCHVEQVHSTVSEAAKAAETLLNLSQSGTDNTQSEELAGAYNKALEYKFLGRCLPPVPRKEVKLKFCPLCDIRVSSDVFDWHMKAMHDGLGQDFDEPVSDQEESSGILLATDGGKNSIVCCGILFDNAESVAEHVQICHVRKVVKTSHPASVQDHILPPVAGEEVVCDQLGEGELVAFVTEDVLRISNASVLVGVVKNMTRQKYVVNAVQKQLQLNTLFACLVPEDESSEGSTEKKQGLNSFEELRKYVKDGGDMAKEIATILHERSELEASYAKGLSKLAAKLMKTARESTGTIPAAWQAVGSEMETEAELHKTLAVSLSEDLVKPVRCVIENHHRSRKAVEVSVDKTARCLAEWRAAQAKAKKQCYMCARDNEKMQDVGFNESRHGRSRTLSEKETAKLDGKRKKSEEALRKADVEYYAYCVRAERARLDWDAATCRGSQCFQAIEEERLTQLRDLAAKYHSVVKDMGPKLVQSADRLSLPIMRCNIDSDLQTVVALRSAGSNASEQLLPDFYSEHMSNIMNRERRRESLEKCLHLICSDIERERRAKAGVENLARALQETPNFGSQESQQDVSDKLKHLKAMLAFLEATKVKVTNALADLENRPKAEHPLVKYLEVHKDKQGLIQSVLKLPSWAHELDSEGETPTGSNSPDFPDGGIGDEASVQPDSDFDEFSSQESDSEDYPHSAIQSIPSHSVHSSPVLETSRTPGTPGSAGRCRALYTYTANMYDELTINPGDIINIHDKQEDGWWVGEHDGNIGIFPATYVEEIE